MYYSSTFFIDNIQKKTKKYYLYDQLKDVKKKKSIRLRKCRLAKEKLGSGL